MIDVEQALAAVLAQARPPGGTLIAVADALGLVLDETVTSDVDSPPHDKSVVDGYAVVSADLASGSAELLILEEVLAGAVPARRVEPGTATRLMTGAPLPQGADAVVMIEHTSVVESTASALGLVRIKVPATKTGQNIMPKGASMRIGAQVVARGQVIRPIEIGLFSEVGRTSVKAVPRPRVAVAVTGDELVAPNSVPLPGQIRNSNGLMLLAAVRQAGGVPVDLGIARDNRQELDRTVRLGLEADILVLSGGVSAGVADLVPGVLADAGVECIFHKVRLKPGKPLWFGVRRTGDQDRLVFGLPGNPVSSLVCFELFVRPAIARLAGRTDVRPRRVQANLSRTFFHHGERPTYHPAILRTGEGQLDVEPLPWRGSGDLAALAGANALVHFPPGDRNYQAGEPVETLAL